MDNRWWQRLRVVGSVAAGSALLLTAACDQASDAGQAAAAAPVAPAAPAGAGAVAPADGSAVATGAAGATGAMRPSAAAGAQAPAAPTGQAGAPTAGAAPSEGGAAGAPAEPAQPSGDPNAAAGSGAAGEAAIAGAGAPAAGSGEPAAAGAGGTGLDPLMPDWTQRMDEGKGDGSDVITIGDSWMDYIGGGGGIEAGLDRAGTDYRHYGLSATTLLSGQIPGQYTRAKAADPNIRTVIMTGGGNDIMFSGGCNTKEACEESVARIQAGLDELWTEMAADGVKDVIYIQYSEDAGTAPSGTRPDEVKPVPICLTGKIICHSLATTDLVMGRLVDGIHPSASANDSIAEALIAMMEERKMRR